MDFVCMCSCSDTGNMQLPYNSPGGYLVHVLFSQWCVYFPINGPGRPSRTPRYQNGLPGRLAFSSLTAKRLRAMQNATSSRDDRRCFELSARTLVNRSVISLWSGP